MAEEDKASFAERFFSITTWKQVMITIVLGGFVLLAWIVYMNQGRFVAAVEELLRHEPQVKISEERILEVTQELMGIPGVVAVTVWNVDLQSNRRWLVGWSAVEPAQAWIKKWEKRLQGGYPVFRTTPGSNMHMVEVLNGGVGCGPLAGPEGEVNVLQNIGVKSECVVGVPPEAGALAGAMYVGFDQELPKERIEALRAPIWTAAQALVE
jgi:hypothetical protein